jgi:hypothetical protein
MVNEKPFFFPVHDGSLLFIDCTHVKELYVETEVFTMQVAR